MTTYLAVMTAATFLVAAAGLAAACRSDVEGDLGFLRRRLGWLLRFHRTKVEAVWVRCDDNQQVRTLLDGAKRAGHFERGFFSEFAPWDRLGSWEGLVPSDITEKINFPAANVNPSVPALAEGKAPPFRLLALPNRVLPRWRKGPRLAKQPVGERVEDFAVRRNRRLIAKHRKKHPRRPGGWPGAQ